MLKGSSTQRCLEFVEQIKGIVWCSSLPVALLLENSSVTVSDSCYSVRVCFGEVGAKDSFTGIRLTTYVVHK